MGGRGAEGTNSLDAGSSFEEVGTCLVYMGREAVEVVVVVVETVVGGSKGVKAGADGLSLYKGMVVEERVVSASLAVSSCIPARTVSFSSSTRGGGFPSPAVVLADSASAVCSGGGGLLGSLLARDATHKQDNIQMSGTRGWGAEIKRQRIIASHLVLA